ncbi:hypothetical protein [Sagittula salina]|uniref:Uncharacterized protein n=1 Tax=Sagittula salina TaxID=2820268 RepID=A0A940MRH4_9RHOB|nr:hypothetical protein [Sagittula salina]MBP0482712.1 hypothetical protein [Sagittula salina]
MSRRDGRKAVELCLPEDLRRRLVRTSEQHLPLAYLVRQALRRALDAGTGWQTDVLPGDARPILLQLSAEELARLEMHIRDHDVPAEVAVLSLISQVV